MSPPSSEPTLKSRLAANPMWRMASSSLGRARAGAVHSLIGAALGVAGAVWMLVELHGATSVPATPGWFSYAFVSGVGLFLLAWLAPSPWKEMLEDLAKGGALVFAVYWFAGQPQASDLSLWGPLLASAGLAARTFGSMWLRFDEHQHEPGAAN